AHIQEAYNQIEKKLTQSNFDVTSAVESLSLESQNFAHFQVFTKVVEQEKINQVSLNSQKSFVYEDLQRHRDWLKQMNLELKAIEKVIEKKEKLEKER